ncbi:MAG TPA: peptidase MA family metallohydrolase, partial [Myxococcota bacterium]|nr:peptidase MA family metallohydrolase [Myxococcota bacterium]
DARGLAGATGLTVKEIETSGTIAVCKFHRLMITSPLATADGYAWADTVAHEFTHLVISKKSRNSIPIWLHEGIAKYFESRWKGPAGQALTPYSEKLLADAVRTGKFITFAQMHPSMAKLPSQQDAALAFAEVFTVIEFLAQKYGTGAIAQVLTLAGDGVPLEKALVQAFGADLKGIEKAWKRYLSKRPFREVPGATPEKIRLATGNEDPEKEKPLESMPDKAVHDFARLGELLQLRGQPKAAALEYEKAMTKGGAHYSTLVNRLAKAYLETDRSAEALRLLDHEVASHPDDSDAHLLAGRIRLKREEWDRAREHFESVRLQNPFNPEIHAALAALYKGTGNGAASAQEQHFLELARVPRPARPYELPTPSAGEARLRIVSVPWGAVRIDGAAPVPTPAWDHAVKAGPHTLELVRPEAAGAPQSLTVGAGETATVVLR